MFWQKINNFRCADVGHKIDSNVFEYVRREAASI